MSEEVEIMEPEEKGRGQGPAIKGTCCTYKSNNKPNYVIKIMSISHRFIQEVDNKGSYKSHRTGVKSFSTKQNAYKG